MRVTNVGRGTVATFPAWTRLLLGIIAAAGLTSCSDDRDQGPEGGGRRSGWTNELIDQLKGACLQNSSGLGSKADAYCSCTANRIAATYSVEQLQGGGSFDAAPIKAACAKAIGIQPD
jgi:hypothetical protein